MLVDGFFARAASSEQRAARHRIAVMRERLLADLPVSERRLDVDGVETAVLEGGDGAPLVLLHGVGSFAPEWGRVIPQLARRHRIIAPDLPGLGESAKHAGRLDAGAAVAWLQT
jgi:hypothetical protein